MAYVAHTFTRLELPFDAFDMWGDGHDWGCRLEINYNFQHESERRAFRAVFFLGASKQHAEVAIYKEMLGEDWIGGPVRLVLDCMIFLAQTYYLISAYLFIFILWLCIYVYNYLYIFYWTIYIGTWNDLRICIWYICIWFIYIYMYRNGMWDRLMALERENGSSGLSTHSPSMWLNLLRFAKAVSYSNMNFEEKWKMQSKVAWNHHKHMQRPANTMQKTWVVLILMPWVSTGETT